MRRTHAHTAAIAAAAILLASGGAAGRGKSTALETTGVTLYDCGLAQLEKQVAVNGATRLRIDVTLAHLDDLLASLVVATDGSVRVTGVNYPSVRNLGQAIEASGMANALAGDASGPTMPAAVDGYLGALVGMSVEVSRVNGRRAKGTVLACVDGRDAPAAVEPDKEEGAPKVLARSKVLVLATEGGAVSWIPVDEISSVSPVSTREAAALRDFATQLGKSGGFTETAVELETAKGSKGRLAAAFIRQSPLWRTVYKVTARKEKVILEAWAVVHNDTTEDWRDVEMTLVSGLPKSYVMSVASPRYRHRETRVLEGEGELMPQLGSHTADSLLYDFAWQAVGENFGYGGLGVSGYGRGGGGSGYGVMGAGGVSGAVGEASSSLLQVGSAAAEEQMQAAVEGEISTYRALNKVSIPARTSSLVPLIRRELEGGAFTLVENGSTPSTCVRVKNGTGLALQGGISSFYINGRFRGQAELSRTEPGDIGVWCFGEDPDVSFSRAETIAHDHEALEWRRDELWSHSLKRTTFDYVVENAAGLDRQIALDIRHIPNGRIASPRSVVDTEDDTRKLHLFEVAARSEAKKQVVIEEGIMTKVETTAAALEEMIGWERLPKKQREVLRAALVATGELAGLQEKQAAVIEDKAREEARVAMLTKTLEAAPDTGGRSKMVEKILKEILSVQDRIAKLDRAREALAEDVEEARAAIAKILSGLAVENRASGGGR